MKQVPWYLFAAMAAGTATAQAPARPVFSVVKVREGLARNDYKDPGWYQHPPGTVAHAWAGSEPLAQRKESVADRDVELHVRKPRTHGGH